MAIQNLKDAGSVEVAAIGSYGVDELTINSSKDGSQPKSLMDSAVHLAIEYALDRKRISHVVYAGYSRPSPTMIAPVLGDWHNSDVEAVSFDPTAGNRVLDDAGCGDSDVDGVREYSDGMPLEYRFMAEDNPSNVCVLETISDALAQVGINTELMLLDYDSQLALTAGVGDSDLNDWKWHMDVHPDFAM